MANHSLKHPQAQPINITIPTWTAPILSSLQDLHSSMIEVQTPVTGIVLIVARTPSPAYIARIVFGAVENEKCIGYASSSIPISLFHSLIEQEQSGTRRTSPNDWEISLVRDIFPELVDNLQEEEKHNTEARATNDNPQKPPERPMFRTPQPMSARSAIAAASQPAELKLDWKKALSIALIRKCKPIVLRFFADIFGVKSDGGVTRHAFLVLIFKVMRHGSDVDLDNVGDDFRVEKDDIISGSFLQTSRKTTDKTFVVQEKMELFLNPEWFEMGCEFPEETFVKLSVAKLFTNLKYSQMPIYRTPNGIIPYLDVDAARALGERFCEIAADCAFRNVLPGIAESVERKRQDLSFVDGTVGYSVLDM